MGKRSQHRFNETHYPAARYALSHEREEFLVKDGPEKVFQILVNDPFPAGSALDHQGD